MVRCAPRSGPPSASSASSRAVFGAKQFGGFMRNGVEIGGSHLAAPRVGGATSYSSGAPVMFSGGKRLEAFKRPAAACTDD